MTKRKDYTLEELEFFREDWNGEAIANGVPMIIINAVLLLGDTKYKSTRYYRTHTEVFLGQVYQFTLHESPNDGKPYYYSIYVNRYEVDDWNKGITNEPELLMSWLEIANPNQTNVPENIQNIATQRKMERHIIPGSWWGIVTDIFYKKILASEKEEAETKEEESRIALAEKLMIDQVDPKYLVIGDNKDE